MRLLLGLLCAAAAFGQIRVGIIGTDTSHVPAFTRLLNDPTSPDHIPGAKVVAAYKGGSPDVESSHTRVDKFAEEIRTKYGVEIVPFGPYHLTGNQWEYWLNDAGGADAGANLRAASVIWEWTEANRRDVVWPRQFATAKLAAIRPSR